MKNTFSLILSALAIIIAGCVAFSYKIDLENCSFVLGTLTLLVTLLVGWQIYNTINIEKKMEKKINKNIKTAAETALFVSLSQQGRSLYKGNRSDAIYTLLNALCIWNKRMTSQLANEAYKYCIDTLVLSSKNVISFEVDTAEEKDNFVSAANKTGNREIKDFTLNIKVKR